MADAGTAVDRETAWLAATGDDRPALLKSAGGPFDVVQAYWPRTPSTRQTGVYVMRTGWDETRFANHRRIVRHQFRVAVVWPIGGTTTATGIAETEQRNLDAALALLLARIRDHPDNHTHGGRFMSVAEAPEPGSIRVQLEPADHILTAAGSALGATVTYDADDDDFTA